MVEALGMSAFPALVVITADGELIPYEGAPWHAAVELCHILGDACVQCRAAQAYYYT